MKKGVLFISIMLLGYYIPGISFGQPSESRGLFIPSTLTQGEVVDQAVKFLGMEFFLPQNDATLDAEELFTLKKNLLEKNYPVFKQAQKDQPADCDFLAEVAYQAITPIEKRADASCQAIINELEGKQYKITCACGEDVAGGDALALFNDPRFLNDVMNAVDPVEASPYATALSEAYSTPASPIQ